MANIRSKYIKDLLEDKENLNKTLEESTKEALKGIVDEAVNKNLRSLISEADEDDYDEEEVDDTENILDEPETTEDSVDTETEESGETEDGEAEDGEAEDNAELWDSLEQFKGEDDEYDLTGMDSEDVIKVLKVMKPEDGVRVVKKDNGTLQLTDDENDVEYIIDIDGEDAVEVSDDDDEDVFEIDINEGEEEEAGAEEQGNGKGGDIFNIHNDPTISECGGDTFNTNNGPSISEGKVDLGYTDNYQDKTAMTMDPDDGAKTRKWNAGTPTGNGKRWVGNKGDMSPFNKKVNEADEEEPIVEIELNDNANLEEKAETMANGSRTIQDLHHSKNGQARHNRHRMNGKNAYSGEQNEALKRKAIATLKENKELKAIAEQIKERLNEACVINASLGKIIKLVTENTTTRDEKINIVNRFNNVKSVSEGKALYEAIQKELKNAHPINNVDKVMSGPLTEAKKTNVVETQMFQSEDLAGTLDLMKRLDKIK